MTSEEYWQGWINYCNALGRELNKFQLQAKDAFAYLKYVENNIHDAASQSNSGGKDG